MIKVLFIENRQKTKLYEVLSEKLPKNVENHWLVQNHMFAPKKQRVNIIPYPKKEQLKKPKEYHSLNQIIESDRQQNFFGKKSKAYFLYYYQKIAEVLNQIKPDIVFGESTAFHELLAIKHCKNNDILYLNPCTCRYPKGRFSFYMYDTLEPYLGSDEHYTESELQKTITQINNNEVKPDYMKVKKKKVFERLKNQGFILWAFILGERFNTPHPFKKFILEYQKKKRTKQWNITSSEAKIKEKNVLYPLQMQPEANIDVWGRQHRNQLETIKSIYTAMPKEATLYVKPNPKLKYEVSKNMIEFIENTPRVIAIPTHISMKDIIADIDVVVTVTGTIALERIFLEKPVITLVKTLNNTVSTCKHAKDKTHLKELIFDAVKKSKTKQKPNETPQFLNSIIKKSYTGIISDPYSDSCCISLENINNLANAFSDVINNVNSR